MKTVMKMKKILVLLTFVLFSFMLTGCSNKNGITKEEFKKKMIQKNFYVNKSTNPSGDTIKTILFANNKKFQIEFYEFKTEKYAKDAYNSNKKMFKNYKKKNSKEKETSSDNYNYYFLDKTDTYYSVARSGKTLLYTQSNSIYKKDIKNIFKELNY